MEYFVVQLKIIKLLQIGIYYLASIHRLCFNSIKNIAFMVHRQLTRGHLQRLTPSVSSVVFISSACFYFHLFLYVFFLCYH